LWLYFTPEVMPTGLPVWRVIVILVGFVLIMLIGAIRQGGIHPWFLRFLTVGRGYPVFLAISAATVSGIPRSWARSCVLHDRLTASPTYDPEC
jgi:hypothetical protein